MTLSVSSTPLLLRVTLAISVSICQRPCGAAIALSVAPGRPGVNSCPRACSTNPDTHSAAIAYLSIRFTPIK
jgi:hypothetical protein